MHSVLCIAYKYSTYLEITLLFGCSYAFCCFDGKCASENAFCFTAMQSKRRQICTHRNAYLLAYPS